MATRRGIPEGGGYLKERKSQGRGYHKVVISGGVGYQKEDGEVGHQKDTKGGYRKDSRIMPDGGG